MILILRGVRLTIRSIGAFQVTRYFDNEVLEQLACVQNERVYDVTLSGQNAWFEARQVEPHVSPFPLHVWMLAYFCVCLCAAWVFCPRAPRFRSCNAHSL